LDAKTYGDSTFALSATANSGLTVSFASSDTSVATVAGSTVTILKAGSSVITASQSGGSGYAAATPVPQTLTVNRKAATVTAEAKSKTYGSANPALTYTTSTLVGSDTLSGSLATSATANSSVSGSPYTITQGTVNNANNPNYDISYTSANLTVNTKSLTVTANNVSKVQGGTLSGGAGSTAFTSSGLVTGDGIDSVTISYTSGSDSSATAGSYVGAVVPSAATGTSFAASNYSISYVTGDLTVTANPAISVIGSLSSRSATYGTASTAASFSVSGGFLSGDLSVSAPSGFEISTSSGSGYGSSLNLGATSGTVSSTTIYVRLAATTAAGTYSGNVSVSGGGATTQNVANGSSTVAPKALTITGLSGVNKVYDRTTTASTTGTASFSGLVNGESFSVTGTPTATFANANVGTSKVVTITGYSTPSANYSLADPTVSADITAVSLTIPDAAVTAKTYDGSNAAVVTGTLTGVVGSDTVNFSGTGTFADANAGTGIAVTSTSTISGAQSANYSLTQPTGLTGDITKASQTITFGALANKTTADVPFALSATTTATGLTVAYSSSNPAVATVSGSTVTIVGPGSSTITASQAGNQNYNGATSVQQTLTVTAVPTLTEVYVPQFMEGGVGTTNSKRVPYAFRVTLTNLNPSATYRYFNAAVIDADTATSTGAGNPIFVTDTGSFGRSTGGSLSTAGSYSTFTTDANGSYTGWFMLEPTGNSTRFATAGTQVKMRIILNSGVSGNTTATTFLTTASYVTVTPFGATSSNGTAIRGASSASAKNFVLLYDNTTGTGRPLAATVVEGDGVANTTANSYASFYATNVDEASGAWGAIIPNSLANGVRRIENRAKADGSLVAYSTDADGTWPSGVSTVNPNGGDTTVLVVTSTDAPLVVPPQIASSGSLSALSTTYGTDSSSTQFSVSGANMTAGILVTPPAGFEVSTSSSFSSGIGTSSNPITVGASGTIASTTVYVRLAAAASAGSKSGNITLTSSGATGINVATVASTVSQKGITISGLSGVNKVYNGSTTATTSGTASYSGLVNGESFSVTGTPTAAFADANVGSGKSVTVSGYTAPTANYSISQPTGLTANITAQGLTGSFTAANKTYDGTTAATVTGRSLTGKVGSDDVSLTGGTATFDTASAGSNKTVTLAGASLSGAAAANYSLGSVSTTTASITAVSLGSGDITITPVGDGSFTASATGVSGFSYSYSGRTASGVATSYGPSSSVPTAPGFYTVTATSTDGNYSGSGSSDYYISGPVAVNDALTKPADNQPFVIEATQVLSNDVRITSGGAVSTSGLTVTGVTSGSGNTAELDGDVLFTPSSNSTDTFTYTVSDGSKTATATVTVTTESSAPTFTLAIVKLGTATYSAPNTTVTHDFIGVPNQTYLVEYTTNLNGAWTSAGNQSTGATGSFSVTLTTAGNVASSWNTAMFFRAKVVANP